MLVFLVDLAADRICCWYGGRREGGRDRKRKGRIDQLPAWREDEVGLIGIEVDKKKTLGRADRDKLPTKRSNRCSARATLDRATFVETSGCG
jgi:hypothetical protein